MLKIIYLFLLTIFVPVNCNYCTDQCQFSLYFDDPLHIPENCPNAYGHTFLICHVDLEVNYIENTIDINLYSEENATPYPVEIHYRMDINGSFEKPNERMTARLQYSCTVLDDCARTYLIKIYEMLSNHKPVLYVIKDNLYDSANSKVEQCYNLDNQTVDCKNGRCRAEVGTYIESDHPFDPISYYRTYCDYYPPGDPFNNKTGLSTINTYGIPTYMGVFNTIHYVCNKNLCNNDATIKLIQNLTCGLQ